MNCPNCKVSLKNSGGFYSCDNCSFEQKVRPYKHSRQLTPSQEYAIWAATNAVLTSFYKLGDAEIKEFRCEVLEGGSASVSMTVGYKGDEGTLNEVFSRNHAHFTVGRKGAYWIYGYTPGKGYGRKSASLLDIAFQDHRERMARKAEAEKAAEDKK